MACSARETPFRNTQAPLNRVLNHFACRQGLRDSSADQGGIDFQQSLSDETTLPFFGTDLSDTEAASPTAHLLETLQLHGYRPFEDEPDPRPLPEPRNARGLLYDSFDAVIAMLADTRLEADLPDVLWSMVNLFHRRLDRIERDLDDNEQAQRRLPTVLPACNSDQRTLPPIAEAMNLHLAEIATEASAAPLPSSGQIGGELELAVSLEEQHLFPVLKKHKETKNLVQDALSDNREVRKLLGQLERTLKDDENFLPLEGHGAEETIPAARTRREEGTARRCQGAQRRRG